MVFVVAFTVRIEVSADLKGDTIGLFMGLAKPIRFQCFFELN